MSLKRALFWSAFWILAALLFNIYIYHSRGPHKALEFLTGYVIEKSLSMDNLFLFLMLFSYFDIKPAYQRRILNYGIMGAAVLRLILILTGVTLVRRFEWILYIFGGILIYSAFKIVFGEEKKIDPSKNRIIILFKKFIPVTDSISSNHFFTRVNGVLYATPLFVVLLLIETTDVVFALDSIPAIFAVTTDPFIVYTSNIFAILGLRSLYFFLERVKDRFIYIKQGVGIILFIAGLKLMLLIFHIKVPILLALGLIVSVLIVSIAASVLSKRLALL